MGEDGASSTSGSENSATGSGNQYSSANLDSSGNTFGGRDGQSMGSHDSDGNYSKPGFDWGGFLNNVSNTLSNMSSLGSVVSMVGVNPVASVPAYGLYKAFEYAYDNWDNKSKWGSVQGPPTGGFGSEPESQLNKQKYESNQMQIRQDWANYLSDISNRTKSRRVAGQTEESNETFTSLLKG